MVEVVVDGGRIGGCDGGNMMVVVLMVVKGPVTRLSRSRNGGSSTPGVGESGRVHLHVTSPAIF